ncbi:MAG: nitrate ABC transporter permease, partial [Peptococcaceae bacterium]|nr:nitrate ABC transporter permease [Peptococcaceae bacterium]
MSMKQKLKKPAIVLVWLFLWQMASVWLGHELLLVSPLRTAETLFYLMQDSNYWFSIGVSLYRIMLGFVLAFIFGTVLAFLAWKFNFVHNFWAPMISVMKATPVAS